MINLSDLPTKSILTFSRFNITIESPGVDTSGLSVVATQFGIEYGNFTANFAELEDHSTSSTLQQLVGKAVTFSVQALDAKGDAIGTMSGSGTLESVQFVAGSVVGKASALNLWVMVKTTVAPVITWAAPKKN
jgi:hypothetical protein